MLVVYILRPFTLRLVLVVGVWCLWVVVISVVCCVVLFGLAEFAICVACGVCCMLFLLICVSVVCFVGIGGLALLLLGWVGGFVYGLGLWWVWLFICELVVALFVG